MKEVSSFIATKLVQWLKDLAYFIVGLKAKGVDPKTRPGIVNAYKRILHEYLKLHCAKCKNRKRCEKEKRPKAFIDEWLRLGEEDIERLGADNKTVKREEYFLNALETSFRHNITAKKPHTCLNRFEVALKIRSQAIETRMQKERVAN